VKPAGYWLRGGAGAGASGTYQDQMVSALFPPLKLRFSSAWLLCTYKVDSEKLTHTVLYV